MLALLASISPSFPRGCVECPPGCPMHARRADEAPGARKLGCHRAPVTPSDTVCLRSACGHDAVTDAPVTLGVTLEEQRMLPPALAQLCGAPAAGHRPTRGAAEPPTDPPRVVRG